MPNTVNRLKAPPEKSTQKIRPRRPKLIDVKDITLGNSGRKVDIAKVAQLAASILDQGLRYPIQIYRLKRPREKYGLAAGQHRLAAFRKLGLQKIPAIVLKRAESKVWRASENLHRAELGILERSEAIVGYARERKNLPAVNNRKPKGGIQPHDKGYSRIARELSFSSKIVAAAHEHVALPSDIKVAIMENPKLNQRRVLDRLCRLKSDNERQRYLEGLVLKSKKTNERRKPRQCPAEARRQKLLLNLGVALLERRWLSCDFVRHFEKVNVVVRTAFVRRFLLSL